MSLESKLTAFAKELGVTFTLKDRPISYSEAFSDVGLLPGFLKRADELSSLCFNYTLGAKYERTEQSTLGVKVILDNFTPDVLRLFCLLDVLNELAKNSPTKGVISLTDMMYQEYE